MGALNTVVPAGDQGGVWIRQEVSLAAQARRAAAEVSRRLGLPDQRISEIELAVTEAATNLNKHAADGALLLRPFGSGPAAAVEMLAIDHGPGMADVAHARQDGVSATGTPGLGLGVLARMADVFDVHSLMGRGTVLVARFRARPANPKVPAEPAPEPVLTGLARPMSGESVCGDRWAARLAGPTGPTGPATDGGETLLVMLCDGLGHGPLAARASEQATAAFHHSVSTDPQEIVLMLHAALAGTRGGALAVARVDLRERRIAYCGVGNISGFVVADDRRSTLLSLPGIVGHHLPRLRTFDADFPQRSSLVLHSDGLTERWRPSTLPGLFEHSSTIIAAQLLREAGVRRDDASVVVLKGTGSSGGGA
ncbi:anti-sigma regulatory factor (Ser/Thr protein kinase) [Catenulispora sp. GP43]|uniref:ATP-binding SpoIIE family protein phosphatase n=1 Tax=Catenulispora sp. GP43 TaxID=3156263 RepID=UPI003515E41D